MKIMSEGWILDPFTASEGLCSKVWSTLRFFQYTFLRACGYKTCVLDSLSSVAIGHTLQASPAGRIGRENALRWLFNITFCLLQTLDYDSKK